MTHFTEDRKKNLETTKTGLTSSYHLMLSLGLTTRLSCNSSQITNNLLNISQTFAIVAV